MGSDTCVICGAPIPEGKMLCYGCEYPIEPSFDTTQIKVSLNGIRDASKFAHLSSLCKGDVVAKSGRFAVNAKSIMGILSLNLDKSIQIEFYCDIPSDVKEGIKNFIID